MEQEASTETLTELDCEALREGLGLEDFHSELKGETREYISSAKDGN
jgi:hypothetical protein